MGFDDEKMYILLVLIIVSVDGFRLDLLYNNPETSTFWFPFSL